MITVTWNETKINLESNSNLLTAVQKQGYKDPHFALMLNQNFIPKSLYENTYLSDGDTIKIIRPMQGG